MLKEEKKVVLLRDTQLSRDQGPVPALSPVQFSESVLQSPRCATLVFFICIVFKGVSVFIYQVAYTDLMSVTLALSSSSMGISERGTVAAVPIWAVVTGNVRL